MALSDPKTSKSTQPGGIGFIYVPWPLIMTIHDCYEPDRAQIVVEAAAEYSGETCGLVMKFVAESAREHWSVN